MANKPYVLVPVKLSPELVDWLDTRVARIRLQLIRDKSRNVPRPTRSSYIREQVEKARAAANK